MTSSVLLSLAIVAGVDFGCGPSESRLPPRVFGDGVVEASIESIPKPLLEAAEEIAYRRIPAVSPILINVRRNAKGDVIFQYSFALPEKGIESYVAELWLRPDSRIVRDLDAPLLRSRSDVDRIVSLGRAVELAKRHQPVGVSACTPFLRYDLSSEGLHWLIAYHRVSGQCSDTTRVAIDAVAAKILSVETAQAGVCRGDEWSSD